MPKGAGEEETYYPCYPSYFLTFAQFSYHY